MAESDALGEPIAEGRCPWCSTPLEDSTVATCPHCGAALHAQHEGDVPGVTQIDALSLATQRRERGRGVRALIGLADEETEGSPLRSVPEPPSDDVRREMLRLRMTALEAEIEAQSAAIAAARAEAAAGRPGAEAGEATGNEAPDGGADTEPDAEVDAELSAEPDASADGDAPTPGTSA